MLKDEEIIENLIRVEGRYLKGSPFLIHLKIDDLPNFLEHFRRGDEVFNVFGIVSRVAEDHYVVYGTDLINACPIEFEVTNKYIVVHMRRVPNDNNGKDCAETLKRFFENIRSNVDPNATIEIE